jgi:glycerol uptake facilitator-like aquaporin
MNAAFDVRRRLCAEFLGTALLVAVVVGSGIMGDRLSDGSAGLALLANALATGAGLVVLIWVFGPVSGAHFNPVVSLSFALQRRLPWKDCIWYVAAQVIGGLAGVMMAHVMFDMALLAPSSHARGGIGLWAGEIVASFGLVMTILGCARARPEAVPLAVGLFIMSGYWFTSSTSFANPAVTVARSLTDTFSGIMPADTGGFVLAQVTGALLATCVFQWLWRGKLPGATDV